MRPIGTLMRKSQPPARCSSGRRRSSAAGEDRCAEHRQTRRRSRTSGWPDPVPRRRRLPAASRSPAGSSERRSLPAGRGRRSSLPDALRHRGTGGREDGEPDQAEQEHPATAEDVSQPCPRDQEDGKGQSVGGAQPLDRAGTSAKFAVNRGARDVHDRGVEQIHGVGGQHHGRHDPAHAVELRSGGRAGGGEGGVHDRFLVRGREASRSERPCEQCLPRTLFVTYTVRAERR